MAVKLRMKLWEVCQNSQKHLYQLAGELKLTPSTFGGIVNGRVNPTHVEMERISKFFNVPKEILFPHENQQQVEGTK